MLVIRNLTLSIDGKKILDSISLEFSSVGLVTILGPNGSGKSTLIKCIAGVYDQWTGEIILEGRDIRSFSIMERARIVSYVPQLLEVYADYSVWDFLEMSYYPHLSDFGSLSTRDRKFGAEILERFNLTKFRNRSLMNLSGGERQRVFIAASVFQRPKLLLLDEPTSFLDPKIQDDINEVIFSLQKDMSVILISHDINSTLINSKRIIALKSGRSFYDGSPGDILNENRLNQLYDKKFQMIKHPSSNVEIVIPEVFK